MFRALLSSTIFLTLATLSGATDWTTLDYLYEISGKGTVAGVHNKESQTPYSFSQEVEQITGKTPGLWSGDFLFSELHINNRWTMIEEAKRQWEAGAIVNIMWHACNPAMSEPCWWKGGDGPNSKLSDSQWKELISEGTPLNNRWKQMMDDVSQYLEHLQDAGVDVLFRPLHEMNQGEFWWGGREGEDGTSRLYQITHDYFTNTKGLTNLIWTWNIQDLRVQDSASLQAVAKAYNPGTEYWEVASIDVYEGFEDWKYDAMRNIGGGRPIAIGECGKLPSATRLANEKLWTFFMSWSDELKRRNTDEEIRSVYGTADVLTLDELPGSWDNPGPPTGGNFVFLRSAHNTYLSAWDDGSLIQQAKPQDWEEWKFTSFGNGLVVLQSHLGSFLSAWPDGSVRLSAHLQAWEYWTEVQNDDNTISFRSHHNSYLSAWSDRTVRLSDHNLGWEHWST